MAQFIIGFENLDCHKDTPRSPVANSPKSAQRFITTVREIVVIVGPTLRQ